MTNCPHCEIHIPFDTEGGRLDHHLLRVEGRKKSRRVICLDRGRRYWSVIQPAMNLANKLDIGTDHAGNALYDCRAGVINVWCTPEDNPGGPWKEVAMTAGAHCKKSEFVGSVSWELDDNGIVLSMVLDTSAYALQDTFPDRFTEIRGLPKRRGVISIYDRRDDLAWVRAKARLLFKMAGIDLKARNIPIVVRSKIKKSEEE